MLKFDNGEDFVRALYEDAKILNNIGIKYKSDFPQLSLILSVLVFALLNGEQETLYDILTVCYHHVDRIHKSIDDLNAQQVDTFLDTLNIDANYFKSTDKPTDPRTPKE